MKAAGALLTLAMEALVSGQPGITVDPLTFAVQQAQERLREEERRYALGASTDLDVMQRQRALASARRAVAMRDNRFEEAAALFESEGELALRQLDQEQRRFQLGASTGSDLAGRRREAIAIRRAAAEWKSLTSAFPEPSRILERRRAKELLGEEIAAAQGQLAIEERKAGHGVDVPEDALARLRSEIVALQQRLANWKE